jgi:hypothetical protein
MWTLYYEDGSTFTSAEGEPNDSSEWGVVCITQNVPNRDVVWNENYYIYRTDRGYWTGHDLIGFVDQQVHFAPYIICVRVGRDGDTTEFKRILKEATIKMRGK